MPQHRATDTENRSEKTHQWILSSYSYKEILFQLIHHYRFYGGSAVKIPPAKCRRPRFDLWAGKIPWRKKWQPTPVFLPEKSHRQRSLMGHSLWVAKSQTLLCDWTELILLETHCIFIFLKHSFKKNFFFLNSLILGCVGSSLLRRGFSPFVVLRLLVAVAFLVLVRGLQSARASEGSWALEHRLSSCGARA